MNDEQREQLRTLRNRLLGLGTELGSIAEAFRDARESISTSAVADALVELIHRDIDPLLAGPAAAPTDETTAGPPVPRLRAARDRLWRAYLRARQIREALADGDEHFADLTSIEGDLFGLPRRINQKILGTFDVDGYPDDKAPL
jgi:hypothetical protein